MFVFESGEFKDDGNIISFKFLTLNGAPLIAFVFVFCNCVLYHDSCWRINLKLDIEHTLKHSKAQTHPIKLITTCTHLLKQVSF